MDAATLPPYGHMYMVGLWIETLLYGMNCVLFFGTIYILLTRKQKLNKTLFISTILLFALSTAHIGLSLRQLLEAFTDPAVALVPHGADIYFVTQSNPLALAQYVVYSTNVFGLDLMLIWRLYVVWGNNRWIFFVMTFLECVHMTCSYTAIAVLTRPGGSVFSKSVLRWGRAGWSMSLILTTITVGAIAFRLWRQERMMRSLHVRGRSYAPAIFTIVESGAIFFSATLVMFIFNLTGNPATPVGIPATTQLATMVPLLIVVRVGLGISHGAPPTTVLSEVPNGRNYRGPTFATPRKETEITVTQFQESTVDYQLDSISPYKGKDNTSLRSDNLV